MKAICKYMLASDRNILLVPADPQFLSVQMQRGGPVLWVLVDLDRPRVDTTIAIYDTNERLPADPGKYLGTYQTHAQNLEYHVFLETPR